MRRPRFLGVLLLLLGAPAFAQDPSGTPTPAPKLDVRAAVIELRLTAVPGESRAITAAGWPSFKEALAAAEKLKLRTLVSADAVRAGFDDFNDGLIAGVQLACGKGNGGDLQGKLWLSRALLDPLLERRKSLDEGRRPPLDRAIVYVAGTLAAAGETVAVPPELAAAVKNVSDGALVREDFGPTPFGWKVRHPDLRSLQRFDIAAGDGLPLEGDAGALAMAAIQEVLFRNGGIETEARLQVHARMILGGPLAGLSVEDTSNLFKPGDSYDTLSREPARLAAFRSRMQELPAWKPRAQGGNIPRFVLTEPVPDFEATLAARLPTAAGAGYQARLLAAARSPEGLPAFEPGTHWPAVRRDILNALYRRPLLDIRARAPYTQGLDDIATDAFELQAPPDGPPVRAEDKPAADAVLPSLHVEPQPDFYRALHQAIRSLRKQVLAGLGAGVLTSVSRMDISGQFSPVKLQADFDRQEALYLGLYLMVCDDLGLEPSLTADDPPEAERLRAREAAGAWCGAVPKDPVLARDARFALRLSRKDPDGTHRVRAYACLGVRLVPIRVEWQKPPTARDAQGNDLPLPFAGFRAYLPTRILREVDFAQDAELHPDTFRTWSRTKFKAPDVRFLSPTDPDDAPNYDLMMFGSCGACVVVLGLLAAGSWWLKTRMQE